MKMFFKKAALSLFSLAVCVGVSKAKVTPNSLFGNNGVLQQGVEVPVWGTANDGEEVTVEFAGQKHVVKATNGKWLIKLKPLKASATPQDMLIKGENTVTIKNILVGEVWLLSGQSNMAFPLRAIKPIGNSQALADVLKEADYPLIRQFSIPLRKSVTTPEIIKDVNGKWNVCTPTNAGNFSAVGFFFARDLFKRLNVPIGLINSSYGGTAIENWVSKETLDAFPELQSIITNYNKALKDFPAKLAEYQANEQKLMAEFKADSAYAAQQNKPLPRKPAAPMSPAERGGPTGLYNTMIHPLIPYAMKGSVWYQGEANGSRGKQYRTLLPALINSWRAEWGLGDFPFIIVQIPGWKAHQPELREAQLLTWKKIKNTAMTVITDVDDTLDVHPGNKQPVGERVALQARAIAYQDKIVYAGPVYESMKIEGNQAILSFSHVGKGLVVKGTELKDFIIAGADKKFYPAKAIIKGDKIIVSADAVKSPVAVRMGWRICPEINLYNKEGLCATAFRTDVD